MNYDLSEVQRREEAAFYDGDGDEATPASLCSHGEGLPTFVKPEEAGFSPQETPSSNGDRLMYPLTMRWHPPATGLRFVYFFTCVYVSTCGALGIHRRRTSGITEGWCERVFITKNDLTKIASWLPQCHAFRSQTSLAMKRQLFCFILQRLS